MTIWRAVAAVAVLSLAGVSVSSRAVADAAQPTLRCMDAATALKSLQDHSNEKPVFNGVTIGGTAAMITVSPSGTWTMMMAAGDKLCPIAAGDLIKTEGAKPEPNNLPAAPALLAHGLRLIAD